MMTDWGEKNRDTSVVFFIKGMKMFWEFIGLGGEKRKLTYVFMWLIVLQVLALLFPYLLKLLFDELPQVVAKSEISSYLIAIIVGMFVIKIVTLIIDRFIKEVRLVKSIIKLENAWPVLAQKKLLSLSLGYHEKENTGKKIAKIDKGCNKLIEILMNLFCQFLPRLLYVIINIIFIVMIDWRLGILFFIPFIPAVWLNMRCYDLFAHKWDEWDRKKEVASGLFCQSLINVSTVQGFVQEKREEGNFARIREEMNVLDVSICLQLQKYIFLIAVLLHTFFVLTIIAGVYFVYQGESTVGTVIYIIATGNVTIESIWQLTDSYTKIMKHMISVVRMKTLFDEEVEVKESSEVIIPERYNGNFVFNNTSFRYKGKEKSVLEDLNLRILPNQMVALVSRSGEGKTTIIRLLCRMYDVSVGVVELDGKDIRELDVSWYRRLFAIVQQDVDIFEGSIGYNIRYPYPDAPEEQVAEAIQAAHLQMVTEDSERFPDSINTHVGERGVRLSGGERQRVGIARAYLALLNGAKVLVLDEATSSLDSEAERAIQNMIDTLRERMSLSIVAIAHRLSTIRKADMIYVIGNGNIIEEGDHDRLMLKNGLYSQLANLQKIGALRK